MKVVGFQMELDIKNTAKMKVEVEAQSLQSSSFQA